VATVEPHLWVKLLLTGAAIFAGLFGPISALHYAGLIPTMDRFGNKNLWFVWIEIVFFASVPIVAGVLTWRWYNRCVIEPKLEQLKERYPKPFQ